VCGVRDCRRVGSSGVWYLEYSVDLHVFLSLETALTGGLFSLTTTVLLGGRAEILHSSWLGWLLVWTHLATGC